MTPHELATAVARTIRGAFLGPARKALGTELELQDAIERALVRAGFVFEREAELAPGDRIDFLVAESCGVECKVGGSRMDAMRQLHRYAQVPAIASLVLATTRFQHARMPTELAGKPVLIAAIMRGL